MKKPSMPCRWNRMRLAILTVVAFFLLSACAAQRQAAKPRRNWPRGPVPTRIAWTGSASAAPDLGIRPRFWGGLWRTIVGIEPEEIERPHGIHADCRKRILVVDTRKKGIHLFDRGKGSYSFVEGPFAAPIGVTEDAAGIAYVSDAAAGKIYRFELADPRPQQFLAGLKRPTGIAFNPTNSLIYVVDTLAAQVIALDRLGREKFRFGGPGQEPGEFNRPTDVAVDFDGRIYVTDAINARIQIFSREGKVLKVFGEPGDSAGFFAKPKGLAVNSDGQIYVCDAQHDAVQVFDREGRLLLSFGTTGSGPGEFWMPSGIAIDKDDNIYIADTFNKRIQSFTYFWQDQ